MTEREHPDVPEPGATDQQFLSVFEELDEDDLDVDPLEEGVEPPEQWSGATAHGTTAREQAEGETLDQRLAAERPDPAAAEPPERTVAETPLDELDASVDDEVDRTEPAAEQGVTLAADEAEASGQPAEDQTGRLGEPTDAGEESAVHVREDTTG